jgi:hypothetical protein
MIVNNAPKALDAQLHLWTPDKAMKSMAQSRNWSGAFFEEATANLLHGTRLKTDGNSDVCPDVLVAPGVYAESKGVGKTNAMILYDHRVQKDRDWTLEHGATLLYCAWHHCADCKGAAFLTDLHYRLARATHDAFLLTSDQLFAHCDPKDLRVINTKPARAGQGYGGRGYKSGWYVPLRKVRETCTTVLPRRASSCGESFQVRVHCAPGTERYVP